MPHFGNHVGEKKSGLNEKNQVVADLPMFQLEQCAYYIHVVCGNLRDKTKS